MKKIWLLFLFIFILSTFMLTASASDTKDLTFTVMYDQESARDMLEMINEFRQGSDAWYWNSDNKTKTTCSNLGELTYDYDLEEVAMQRAAEIALYYSHTRPDGSQSFTAYGSLSSSYTNKGENIVQLYGDSSVCAYAFTTWCENNEDYSGQGHRRLMLSNKINAVGVGHVIYNGKHYWVMELAYATRKTQETEALYGRKEVTVTVKASDWESYYNTASQYVSFFTSFKIDEITNTAKGVKITWDKLSAADGYYVYRKTGSGKYTKIAKTLKSSYTDTDVVSGKTYKYKVVPYTGKTKGSGVAQSTVYLARPSFTSVTSISERRVDLTWNNISGADGYEIEYSFKKNGRWYVYTKLTSKLKLARKSLNSGKTYTFRIRAYTEKSGVIYYSAWSSKSKETVL